MNMLTASGRVDAMLRVHWILRWKCLTNEGANGVSAFSPLYGRLPSVTIVHTTLIIFLEYLLCHYA